MAARFLRYGLAVVLIAANSVAFGKEWTPSEIEDYRQMEGIPVEERQMSVEQLVDALEEREPWAIPAVRLRCMLGDASTRGVIYDKLVDLAIREAAQPKTIAGVFASVMSFLDSQKEHRDEAVAAVLQVLASTTNPFAKNSCYGTLGSLGGPEAVRMLKAAILEDPPEDFGLRELYQNLGEYMRCCGPEAAPILLEGIEELDGKNKYKMYLALGASGNEIAATFLLEKARQAKAAGETYELDRALRSAFEEGARYTPETRQLIAAALLEEVGSEHVQLRYAVALGLAKVGDAGHIAILEDMAANDPYSAKWYPLDSEGNRTEEVICPVRIVAAEALEALRERLAREEAAAQEKP